MFVNVSNSSFSWLFKIIALAFLNRTRVTVIMEWLCLRLSYVE